MPTAPRRPPLPRADSAESRILFLSAGGVANDAALRALLRGPVDWPQLARMALCEGAAGIVHRRIRRLADGDAIAEIDRHLKPIGLVSEFQLAMLEQQFERLAAALGDAGIEVVLLKGAGLACSVYDGFAERPMTDVDLLVSPDAATRAYELARQLRWVHRADIALDRDYASHQHLPPLEDGFGIGVGLEIHTELFVRDGPFRFTADDIRARARTATHTMARGALVPDVHDQLLHACLHFVWSHEMRFGAWRTLRDVDRIVATGDIRWDELVRRARDSRGASCCYWALDLARQLARTDIPKEVLSALRPRGVGFIRAPLARHLAMQLVQSEQACPSAGLSRAAWRLAVQPRRHGHGSVVPWNLVEAREPAAPRRGSGPTRLRKVGRLVRYLGAVVVPAISGS